MIQLFEQLRNTEKALDATRQQLTNANDDLLAERKRNLTLAEQVREVNRLAEDEHDKCLVYKAAFWAMTGITAAAVLMATFNR